MKHPIPLEDLLNWRTALAEAEAPPPPRAARMLELARPWWELRPEQFRALVQQFGTLMGVGYAMDPGSSQRENHPVPAVITRTNVETTALADILYFSIQGRILRMRFHLRHAPELRQSPLEVTFVAPGSAEPLFFTEATLGRDGNYRIEYELRSDIADAWARLRVTERMPFRFILRAPDEV